MQRTRRAVLDAFFVLVLRQPYEQITVRALLADAGVGRSTLYEHFRGKDGVLAASLEGPFGVLADAVQKHDNTAELTALLAHFWANRALARGIFTGAMRHRSVTVLVRLVEQRLRTHRSARQITLLMPTRLAAIQLAEALFAPIVAWLTAESACSAPRLARALRRTASALLSPLP